MKEILQINPEIKILFEFHPQVLADYNTQPKELLKILDESNFQMFDILQEKFITSDELLKTYPNKKTPQQIFYVKKCRYS